jgi:hypothetical protein
VTLLTDEHVSPAVANALRSEGIDAVTIYDTPVVGGADPDVLAFASENGYAVLTNDQDFVTGDFVAAVDHRGVFFYEDQRTSRKDIVRSDRGERHPLPSDTDPRGPREVAEDYRQRPSSVPSLELRSETHVFPEPPVLLGDHSNEPGYYLVS